MIHVTPEVYEKMLVYAQNLLPNEACGALIGTIDEEQISVQQFYPIPNISLFPEQQFILHPNQWIQCLYAFKEGPVRIVGIFHSHPTGTPVPSFADMQLPWNFPTYWILSLARPAPNLKAYKLMPHNQYVEQQIAITSTAATSNKISSAPLSG